jgi:4-amino-4-deoxy-L-arabinose transferase-like glycosyltransferase
MPLKIALLLIVFLGALWFRLPGLDSRPFHVDEANNAFLLEETLQQGGFHYRPSEHHGPTLFYLAELPCKIFGIHAAADMDAWMLRAVAAVCGALAAASVLLLVPHLSDFRALTATLMIAVAAPFHYYSRTFIHESLLLLLTIWLLAALLCWRACGGLVWTIVCGVIIGLMVATKENAAISALLIGWPFLLPIGNGSKIRIRELCIATILAVEIILLLIDPENLYQAIILHTHRGLDSGHNWPWYQFLYWFGSYHGPGLPWSVWLGLPLAVIAVVNSRKDRIAAIFSLGLLGLFLFHSLLPYKTPWLMLEPFLLLSLLAAMGLEVLFRRLPLPVGTLMMGLVLVLLFSETWQRSFNNQVRTDNPLAYSPTDPSSTDLVRDLDALQQKNAVIQVVAMDYWPLPWLLRKYPNKGFWQQVPVQWFGDILICSPEALGWMPDANNWKFMPYLLRPGLLIFVGTHVNGGSNKSSHD